ncbi:hypothetical protein Chor_008372, partial [Crotalus horridus]
GNSKYHYYGIRLKPESPLNRLQEDAQYMAMRQQPAHQKQRYRPSQRLDGAAEGGAVSSPTPEESVAAQCQHHQQYIGTLTQAIRNFAKSLESWLMGAMSEFPQPVVQSKVSVVSAFAQTLRRYTSLNHLAQAARAVLQNTSQINQMLSDLNRVDFANVQKLEQDFKVTLQQQSSLDQWARWLDEVVTQVLKPHEGAPSFPRAARQFLLKWSFYSSMVIRDLTLRSAASFGSFHLIRLLYDEYMFYLVEHRVKAGPIFLFPADTFGALGHEAGACKPQVKREHSDPGPSLQEI